jgi:hypothetical protein
MTMINMPEQNEMALTIVRRLSEGTGADYRAAAIVKPVAFDMPIRCLSHSQPRPFEVEFIGT